MYLLKHKRSEPKYNSLQGLSRDLIRYNNETRDIISLDGYFIYIYIYICLDYRFTAQLSLLDLD